MNKLYKNYTIFLDELRIEAGMTELEFTYGVCHDRTYRKYLSGQSVMSQKVHNGLCMKLGFTIEEFLYAFDKKDENEYQKVYELYLYIKTFDKENALKLLVLFKDKVFVNYIAERLYSYCAIYYNELFLGDTKAHIYSRYQKLINYPECLDKKYFDIIDALGLYRITQLELKMKKRQALDTLYDLLVKDDFIFVSSESRNMLPSIYEVTSKGYGMFGELDKSLLIATKGIEYSLKIMNLHDLHNMYYYQALCNYKMGFKSKAILAARNCLYTLVVTKKKTSYIKYYDMLKRDFSIEPSTYLDGATVDELFSEE